MDKSMLALFSISWETATRNGDYLPEYASGTIKYEWDSVEKRYTETPKCVIITAFFYGLKKSKIDILLPANSVNQSTLDDWNRKSENDDDITIVFKNFVMGLKSGFNNEIQIVATADSVATA